MSPFKKHIWLLPAVILISASLGFAALTFVQGLIKCVSLGQWEAVRGYGFLLLLLTGGLIAVWWAYLVIRTQEIDAQGVRLLTVRRGHLAIPWSDVQRATFKNYSALLEAGLLRVRIGFSMYRDYSGAEAFVRARLTTAGAVIQ